MGTAPWISHAKTHAKTHLPHGMGLGMGLGMGFGMGFGMGKVALFWAWVFGHRKSSSWIGTEVANLYILYLVSTLALP
jgi:hypothetical protein